jgi:tRNA-dihydrouridine synthase
MNNFWQDLPKPFFILAPMDAVTDVVFRHVVGRAAPPDLYMTEFTNSAGYCSPKGKHSTRGRLAFTSDEQPIVVQIWGNNPENYKNMSIDMKELGFAGIDINMGCPEKSVVKSGSGIGLCRTPELASELIKSAKAGGLPVSVKTRLGDVKTSDYDTWLSHILRQDIANLTIHLRTRKEMSKVDAHFDLIPAIKKLRDEIAPHTLLTINGDIRDREHGMELVNKYGVDGVMIGRGIFHNPYAFEKEKHVHTKEELIELLNIQLDLHDKYSAELEPRKFDPLKRFFKIYIRDFAGASELRDKLMHTKTSEEARALIANI